MQMFSTQVVRRFAIAGVASFSVLAASVLGVPAAAQGGSGFGMSEINTPEYSQRDLATISNVLQLDEAQSGIVEVFLESYTDAFNTLRQEGQDELEFMREEMQNARRDEGNFDWRKQIDTMMDRMQGYRDRRDVLGYEFVANVQSLLLDEQMELWPKFERTMRRQQLIPRGMISGESVDLFQVVKTAALGETSLLVIDEVLNNYELQLDAALLARDSDMEKAENAFRGAIRAYASGEMDLDDVLDAVERQRRLRTRVRSVNENHARQIVQMLNDPEEAGRFQENFDLTAYPRIYRETYGEQAFNAAMELPELDPNIRNTIEGLADAYLDRLPAFNEKLKRVTREEEPRQAEGWIRMMASRMSGENVSRPEDPIREAFKDREEYENNMVAQLRSLLTDDQARELPRRSQRPEGDGRFSPFGGNRGQGARGSGGGRGGAGRGPGRFGGGGREFP